MIDIRQVVNQILGFLLLLWGMKKFAWGPILATLEARRQKIQSEFDEAARRQQGADDLRAQYDEKLRGIEAQARQRMVQAAAEAEQLASQIRAQAQQDATERVERAQDEIAREREKAKETIKEQIIGLSLRCAEKVLREKVDDARQRRLVGEFIDEVGAMK